MKTIFITVFQSFIARSILGTDAFKILVNNPNTRIVIFAPHYKKDYYREQFNQPNVIVEGINNDEINRSANSFFQKTAILLLPTYFVRYKMRGKGWRGLPVFYYGLLMNYLLSPFALAHKIFRWLDQRLSSTRLYDGFFEKYQPDLVFATDIFGHADAVFLMSAQRHGVKAIGMVRSWDCTTNKNLLRVIPSKVLANNDNIKEELVRLHDVDASVVEPVGFSQFDAFVKPKLLSRTEFFKEINVDPAKKLVLIAPGGILTDIDWQYYDILEKAVVDGRLPRDVHFLVRPHPQSPGDVSKFKNNPYFTLDLPGIVIAGGRRAAEMRASDIAHAANSFYHCELLISVVTSLGLDLLHFDKPHIMLGFDGYEQRPWLKSVRRYHEEDNMKDFIDTGAVRVAKSPQELVQFTGEYLNNSQLDATGRELARKNILYCTDGKAGQRIGNLVTNYLERSE